MQEMELVQQAERATMSRNMLTRGSGGTAAAVAGTALFFACPLTAVIAGGAAGVAYLANRNTLTAEQRLAQDARYQDFLQSRDEETNTRRGMMSALSARIERARARRRSSPAGRGPQARAAAAADASPSQDRRGRGISFPSIDS